MTQPLSVVRGWKHTPGGPERVELFMDRLTGRFVSVPGEGTFLTDHPATEYDETAVILPGDVNAHSHPEQSVYVDLVDPSWDLATWCRKTIYRHSVDMTPDHVYLGCCRAFAHMLLEGVTTAVVSFYCHNRSGNELDRQVIRAARDTGIRLFFGRMHYDVVSPDAYPEKRASQESYFETEADYLGRLEELLTETEGDPLVSVAPCLHSFHANTLATIVQGIRLGAEKGRTVQFHLSEDRGDVDLCRKLYGMRPVEVLDDLVHRGVVKRLSHLLVSDGVWTDDREKDLMAEHGMALVLNPRMNRRVKAGQADLEGYLNRGIELYIGTDGEASNDDLSVENERRFLAECYPELDPQVLHGLGRQAFQLPQGPVGTLEPRAGADLKVLRDGRICDVYVAGRRVVAEGRLVTLDLERDVEVPLKELITSWMG